MRRLLTVALVALLAGAALAGCADNTNDNQGGTTTPTGTTTSPGGTTTPTGTTTTPTSGGGQTQAPRPDTYIIQTIGEPESLDPAYDYESAGGQVISNVYETLYTYDGPSAIDLIPLLAAEMPEASADGKTLTIALREGVKFHDGTDFTAEDVKFSLDRVILHNDPHSPAFIYYSIAGGETYGHIDPTEATQEDRDAYLAAAGVEIVDDHTVRITLDYPDPAFVYKLAYQAASIVSKDAFCANAPEGAGEDCLAPPGETRHTWADTNAVGTGPFKLERWEQGQSVTLVRNDDYWGEQPRMQRVIIQKVDDFNTRLLALKAGEADEVYIPVDHDVDVENLDGIEIIENPSWSVSFIGYNQAFCGGSESEGFEACMSDNQDSVPRGADGAADPLFFADKHMRMAWSHAFDYQTYIDEIVGGHGQLLNGVLPEGIFGWSADVTAPSRDVEAAKEHLAMSNHPNGFQVTIFYNSGNTVREKTAQLLAENLMELGEGIDVDVKALDWSTAFLPKQRQEALPVFYLGWLPDYAFPDNYAEPFAHKASHFAPRINYVNEDISAKIDALKRETDVDTLEQGWKEVVQMLNDDYAYLFLAQASNFHVQRDWVEGYYYNPMLSGAPNSGDFSTLYKS